MIVEIIPSHINITYWNTKLTYKQLSLDELKELAKSKRCAKSFDLSWKKRSNAFMAWRQARSRGTPFNVALSFEYEIDNEFPFRNAKHVFKVCHYYRVSAGRMKNPDGTVGVPSTVLWTRNSEVNSGFEKATVLLYVPDAEYANFAKIVKGWTFEKIDIEQVGYEENRVVNGEHISILEEILSATDAETRLRIRGVYSKDSGLIIGTRVFWSHSLKRECIARANLLKGNID